MMAELCAVLAGVAIASGLAPLRNSLSVVARLPGNIPRRMVRRWRAQAAWRFGLAAVLLAVVLFGRSDW